MRFPGFYFHAETWDNLIHDFYLREDISFPQASIPLNITSRGLPFAVNSYSTFGGTTGNTCLLISLSLSNSLTVWVNILLEISGIFFCNTPERTGPSRRWNKTKDFHFCAYKVHRVIKRAINFSHFKIINIWLIAFNPFSYLYHF